MADSNQLDLGTILGTLKTAGEAAASSKMSGLNMADILEKSQKAQAEMAINIDGKAINDKIISDQTHAFAAETDAKKLAAETALDSNFLDKNSYANTLAMRARDNAEKAYATLDTIKAKESVTLLDSPIDYILNKFTLPADNAEYNTYAQKHNIAEGELDRITQQTNSAAIAANNTKRSTSAALAVAEGKNIALLAEYNKNKLIVDNAPHTISGLNAVNSMNVQQADLSFRMLGAVTQQEQLAMERTRIAQAAAAHALHAKEVEMRVQDRSEQKELMQIQMFQYNAGQKLRGGLEETNPLKFNAMYQNRYKDPDFISTMLSGQLVLQRGSKDNVPIAPTTGAAARMFASPDTNTTGNNVGSMLAKVYNTLESNVAYKNNPTALEGAVTTAARAKAEEDLALVKTKEPNIYIAPALGTLMNNSVVRDVVMQNKFFASTVKPEYDANPNVGLDHNRMAAKYFAYVAQNPAELKMTSQALASYYQQAVKVNNQLNQYGSTMLPIQQKYQAQFDEFGLNAYGGKKANDLTDPLVWEKLGMTYVNHSINSFGSSADIFRARRDAFNSR